MAPATPPTIEPIGALEVTDVLVSDAEGKGVTLVDDSEEDISVEDADDVDDELVVDEEAVF